MASNTQDIVKVSVATFAGFATWACLYIEFLKTISS